MTELGELARDVRRARRMVEADYATIKAAGAFTAVWATLAGHWLPRGWAIALAAGFLFNFAVYLYRALRPGESAGEHFGADWPA